MEKLINEFKISFTKGDTYALAVKFKNIAEDLRNAYFTVKENPDDEPLIQKALGSGIDKIDDRGYKNEKTYKIQLQAEDTANLEARVQYLYDFQVTIDNVVKTVLSGVFVVTHSVTGVTSTTTQSLDVIVDDEVETEILTTPATNGIEYEQDPIARGLIGDLKTLSTEKKDNVVNAINEVNENAVTKANKNEEDINKILSGESTVKNATNATKVNNVEITSDEDGVLKVKTQELLVKIGAEESRDDSINLGRYEFEPLNSGLTVGDIFTYQDETVIIEGEENYSYYVYCKLDGKIAQMSGKEINVAQYVVIPQKRLIWEGNIELQSYGRNNVELPTMYNNKTYEFVFENISQTLVGTFRNGVIRGALGGESYIVFGSSTMKNYIWFINIVNLKNIEVMYAGFQIEDGTTSVISSSNAKTKLVKIYEIIE